MYTENSMTYIRRPIHKYDNYEYREWDEIFIEFRGNTSNDEIMAILNLIYTNNAHNVLDLGVGDGSELISIAKANNNDHYEIKFTGVDCNNTLLDVANRSFRDIGAEAKLINMDWNDITNHHELMNSYDFLLLTGNCLTHDWMGGVEETILYFRSLMKNFKLTLNADGVLFLDSRNFDYILSLSKTPIDKRISIFKQMRNVCYHGLNERRFAFPAFISNHLVVFHYYDLDKKVWSANDFFPVTHSTMLKVLSGIFDVTNVFWDYSKTYTGSSHFIQYLLRPSV